MVAPTFTKAVLLYPLPVELPYPFPATELPETYGICCVAAKAISRSFAVTDEGSVIASALVSLTKKFKVVCS